MCIMRKINVLCVEVISSVETHGSCLSIQSQLICLIILARDHLLNSGLIRVIVKLHLAFILSPSY